MDSLYQSIRKLSEDVGDNYSQLAKKLIDTQKIFKKNIQVIDEALNNLHPSTHTMGYCELLYTKSLSFDPKHCLDFLHQCDALFRLANEKQLTYSIRSFIALCKKFREYCVAIGSPLRGVLPLRCAVLKIGYVLGSHTLTSAHADFVYLTIRSKSYHAALPIIKNPFFQINTKDVAFDTVDYLSYYYYSGTVYCALKQYDKACESFQLALSAPSTAISSIQIASYKKLILSSLLSSSNDLPSLPSKTTSSLLLRSLDNICIHYIDFAKQWKKGGVEECRFNLEQNAELFKKEGNLGLAKQAIDCLTRIRILRLTNTYLTLSLKQIAENSKLSSIAAADKSLRDMIVDHYLSASIDERAGMVRFKEENEQYSSRSSTDTLNERIEEIMDLHQIIKQKDRELSLHPRYLEKTASELSKDREGGGGGGGKMDRGGYHSAAAVDVDDPQLAMALQQSLREK